MSTARAHIIGAGIAGLAAAVRLSRIGMLVSLYEATGQAGGRCRSYHDARLGRLIDNGNHILLSANTAARDYLAEIGASEEMTGPAHALFPFVDLASGARWQLRPNAGPLPWWFLVPGRRIPQTHTRSYLSGFKLAFASREASVADCLDETDPLWRSFWEPLTVAALNTHPREASARLLWLVLRETFLKGESACRPLIAKRGLGPAFIEPALRVLESFGAQVRYGARLRRIEFDGGRAGRLDFGEHQVEIGPQEFVILAVPPTVAGDLLPGLEAPNEARPIVNAHILLPEAPSLPPDLPFLGMVGGTADWLFLRNDVVSLTVSAAESLAESDNDEVARRLWQDTAAALGLETATQPQIRIIKEKRATFAQTPRALARRAETRTSWPNLLLAGDWTNTGYPATIESAVRSGRAAARVAQEVAR